MGGGVWLAAVHRVMESRTRQATEHAHTLLFLPLAIQFPLCPEAAWKWTPLLDAFLRQFILSWVARFIFMRFNPDPVSLLKFSGSPLPSK